MKSGISIVGEQSANFKRGGSPRGRFAKLADRQQSKQAGGKLAGKQAGWQAREQVEGK